MVTDEMVERAAAAMFSHGDEGMWEALSKNRREFWRGYAREAFEAALSAAEPQPAPSVAVKALEWNPFRAETPFGYYHIDDQADRSPEEMNGRLPFLLSGSRVDISRHPTLADAKAAAQADYEARIRLALSAQVQDESEIIDCLLAGKPFIFDPATNFCHADDGGAPEHGIKYVPAAQVQDARSDDDEEIYEIGVREGYERAVQEIDIKTGGDGEYRYCTDHDPERHTPGPAEMIQRIVDRFETLNLIGEAEKRGDFWGVPGSAQVQDVAGFQQRVEAAHHALFHDDPTDIDERRARFWEEAGETVQSFGMTEEDAIELVRYTWSRAKGEPAKEIGAAMLTLASLCVVAGYDLSECAEADLEKLQRPETIARIRAKRSTRHGRGPLPGFDPAAPAKQEGGE